MTLYSYSLNDKDKKRDEENNHYFYHFMVL